MHLTKAFKSKSGKEISLIIFESSKQPRITIIESHGGFTSNAEKNAEENKTVIDFCLNNNVNYVAINFSNNGTQKEQPINELSFRDRIKDLETTIDYVMAEYKSSIILYGSSLGGHITLNASTYSSNIKGIVLNCPAIKAFECIRDLMDKNEFYNWDTKGTALVFDVPFPYSFYQDLIEHNAMKIIPKLKVPVLIFHGTTDTTVPIEQSREAKSLNKNIELIEVESGGHRFDMGEGVWEGKVEHFILETLSNANRV
jgi:pimeloyl-ACP methyl ester carboxylesterase